MPRLLLSSCSRVCVCFAGEHIMSMVYTYPKFLRFIMFMYTISEDVGKIQKNVLPPVLYSISVIVLTEISTFMLRFDEFIL